MDAELRRLVGELPDSRARSGRGEVRTPRGGAVPVYCISCGTDVGFSYVATAAIVALCEECERRCGGLPLPVVDERIVRGGQRRGAERARERNG